MSTRQNMAYDLSRFEPRRDESKESEPSLRKVKRKAVRAVESVRPATVLKWAAACLVLMLLFAGIMVGNIKITQLDEEQSTVKNKLEAARSENVRLNAALENRMSFDKVQNFAGNAGLVKENSYQIQYVNIASKDKVVVSGFTNPVDNFLVDLKDDVMEYFN